MTHIPKRQQQAWVELGRACPFFKDFFSSTRDNPYDYDSRLRYGSVATQHILPGLSDPWVCAKGVWSPQEMWGCIIHRWGLEHVLELQAAEFRNNLEG